MNEHKRLGEAERAVMEFVWAHGPVSAEDCRKGLKTSWPMKESTMRTVLLRLERKGFVTHSVEGRAFLYRAARNRDSVAVSAVKHIIQRFCGGSAEQLVLGLVQHDVLTAKQLHELSRMVAARKNSKR